MKGDTTSRNFDSYQCEQIQDAHLKVMKSKKQTQWSSHKISFCASCKSQEIHTYHNTKMTSFTLLTTSATKGNVKNDDNHNGSMMMAQAPASSTPGSNLSRPARVGRSFRMDKGTCVTKDKLLKIHKAIFAIKYLLDL